MAAHTAGRALFGAPGRRALQGNAHRHRDGQKNFGVDKRAILCFNRRNRKNQNDIDGNLSLPEGLREPAAGVSRCGGVGQSDSRVGLLNAARQ